MVRKLVVDVPDDLKAEFKIYCMKNGTSIHQQIVQFMQDILDGTEETPLESVGELEKTKDRTVRVTDGLVEREGVEIVDDTRARDQQIKEADIEVTLRKALGLKEKGKQEHSLVEDGLNIGFF